MGAELVNSFAPSEGEDSQQTSSSFSYTDFFETELPFYLSVGMSWEQFWDNDVEICKYYRKAYELQRQRTNETLWLQGMYIYEALCDVAPVLHAFAGKEAKPIEYSDRPYPLTEKERMQRQIEKERKQFETFKAQMQAKVEAINKKFRQKEESENARNDS